MARQAPAPCDTTANRERRNAPPPTYPSSENAGRSDRLNPSPAASWSGRERHAVGVYESLCRVFCTTLLRSLNGGERDSNPEGRRSGREKKRRTLRTYRTCLRFLSKGGIPKEPRRTQIRPKKAGTVPGRLGIDDTGRPSLPGPPLPLMHSPEACCGTWNRTPSETLGCLSVP